MNRLYFYRSLITRIRQYLISKSGTNPVTLTNAVEDKLLQGFSITGNSQQINAGGKNIFDVSTATKYSGRATLELSETGSVIQVSQTDTSSFVSANIVIDNADYLIGKTITVSAIARPFSNNNCMIRIMWLNGYAPVTGTMDIISDYATEKKRLSATGFVTAPPTSDCKLCLMLYSNASATLTETQTYTASYAQIQIEVGATMTDYEQYYHLSAQHPSPIQTTELKKSSNLLHTDYFNEPKTSNGVTIQYLADEDCFLFNGTSTVSSSATDTSFVISNAKDRPFTISAFYVGGGVTVPSGTYTGASIGSAETSTEQRSNFTSTYMSQFKTNNTKICDKQYVKDFWFYFGSGVVFDNYKVKISVTKLENSFDTSKVQTTANITNNGDSLLITPPGTSTTATTAQTLSDICPELEVGDNVIANLTLTNDVGVYNAFSSFRAYIHLKISDRTFVAGSQYTITQDDLNSNILFYVSPSGSPTPTENKSTITNISISKIPTNYEPYGKYGLEIKKEGQNYFNVDNFPSLPGNSTYYSLNSNGELVQKEKDFRSSGSLPVAAIIPSGTYTFKSTNSMSNFYLVDLTQNKVINLTSTGKFTVYGETKIGFRSWMEVNTVIGKLQLEQGTEASIYTPYQPPQYNRIWIDKPTLNKNDILTKDKLYVHSKKYLLSDMFDNIHGIPLADYITNNNDTWDTSSIHYEDYQPFNTYVANFSGLCDVMDVYINTSGATGAYLKISTPADSYKVVFVDLVNVSATWSKPSDFQSFLLMNDSYLILYYSGNVEDSFEQLNVSYVDLKPLSAGNNTLTVTNEISPTSCQYKYYSDKEN